jgi:predicted ATP-dependent endonuclease of OLD family
VTGANLSAIAASSEQDNEKVRKAVEREIPTTFSEGFFADAVVFVEGETDRIVLDSISRHLEIELDALGIAILPIGGKSNLRIPYCILSQIEIPVYVIADADALGSARKHPDDPEKQERVAASHQDATDKLLDWLPEPSKIHYGEERFQWGDSTCVTDAWCMFHDDIEHEMESWPSIIAAFNTLTEKEDFRSKNVAAYRAACISASEDDLPASLRSLVTSITRFLD